LISVFDFRNAPPEGGGLGDQAICMPFRFLYLFQ
jgi:hypothetical protein